MTREEAIDIVKCLAWHTRPNEEDIEQAIKALSVEPCDDCISRLDTLMVMKIMMNDATIGDGDNDYATLDDFKQQYIEIIKGMSHVIPKQKMGRWIKVTNGRGGHECGDEWLTKYCPDCWEVLCSECGARKRIEWTNIRYCPMCGAKIAESKARTRNERSNT